MNCSILAQNTSIRKQDFDGIFTTSNRLSEMQSFDRRKVD